MKEVVALAAISAGGVLLVKSERVWVLPGGKMHSGEDREEALFRELKEELPVLRVSLLRFYKTFKDITPESKEPHLLHVYTGTAHGNLIVAGEVKDARWVKEFWRFRLAPATRSCLEEFQANDMFDPADQ